ncbi:MAG: hypothetical protein ABEK02_07610 [Haloquadratum sp.]
MTQEYASGGQLTEEVDAALDGGGESTREDSSTRLERFGAGVAASILAGGVVGVAATTALNAGVVPFIFAVGLGFVIAPIVGVLVLRRSE